MIRLLPLALALALSLSACAAPPALTAKAPPLGPAPSLVPLAPLLAGQLEVPAPPPLEARAARLRARAAALRQAAL